MACIPDSWVILKFSGEKMKTYYRVFGSWRGGYLNGDSWRMNSGILQVDDDYELLHFHGTSGSQYTCHKDRYGIAGSYNHGVLDSLIESGAKHGISIEIMDEYTDWCKLQYTDDQALE